MGVARLCITVSANMAEMPGRYLPRRVQRHDVGAGISEFAAKFRILIALAIHQERVRDIFGPHLFSFNTNSYWLVVSLVTYAVFCGFWMASIANVH